MCRDFSTLLFPLPPARINKNEYFSTVPDCWLNISNSTNVRVCPGAETRRKDIWFNEAKVIYKCGTLYSQHTSLRVTVTSGSFNCLPSQRKSQPYSGKSESAQVSESKFGEEEFMCLPNLTLSRRFKRTRRETEKKEATRGQEDGAWEADACSLLAH